MTAKDKELQKKHSVYFVNKAHEATGYSRQHNNNESGTNNDQDLEHKGTTTGNGADTVRDKLAGATTGSTAERQSEIQSNCG